MSLNAGRHLGAYEILSPLGAVGMGEVYRARDTRLGRDVAIKVLPADRLTDESRRRRFVQEARAASALNHPNIVTIHEIESVDGADFIVMEYVPGKTLAAIMRSRMRPSEVLRIAIPIADALARAHAAGIAHRDLKPANVAVTPEGRPSTRYGAPSRSLRTRSRRTCPRTSRSWSCAAFGRSPRSASSTWAT
jgi:serine/threonine protein kinase